MDYVQRLLRVPAGTVINGAVVALSQDDGEADQGIITADVCIPGPPVP